MYQSGLHYRPLLDSLKGGVDELKAMSFKDQNSAKQKVKIVHNHTQVTSAHGKQNRNNSYDSFNNLWFNIQSIYLDLHMTQKNLVISRSVCLSQYGGGSILSTKV